jgi:hypothetical protein
MKETPFGKARYVREFTQAYRSCKRRLNPLKDIQQPVVNFSPQSDEAGKVLDKTFRGPEYFRAERVLIQEIPEKRDIMSDVRAIEEAHGSAVRKPVCKVRRPSPLGKEVDRYTHAAEIFRLVRDVGVDSDGTGAGPVRCICLKQEGVFECESNLESGVAVQFVIHLRCDSNGSADS